MRPTLKPTQSGDPKPGVAHCYSGQCEQVSPASGRQEETGARLSLEALVEPGRGYMPAEKNKRPDQPIGVIPMDSIFTPSSGLTTLWRTRAWWCH